MILAIDYSTKAIGIAIFDDKVDLCLYGEVTINESLVKPKYQGYLINVKVPHFITHGDKIIMNGESPFKKPHYPSEAIHTPLLVTFQAIKDILSHLKNFPIRFVALDAYFFGNTYKGAASLAEVVGAIKYNISELWPGAHYVIPQPNKKYYFAGVRSTGKGPRTGGRSSRYQGSHEAKELIVRWALSRYGINVSDDVADAIALGKMVATVANQGTWHYLETKASRIKKRKKAEAEMSKQAN